MSESRTQQEPSMEEILASIRRIISEDGQEPRPTAAPAPEQASEQPSAVRTYPRPERPAMPPDPEGDVLTLTEMVVDDGSVVSLADAKGAASERVGAASLPEPPEEVEQTETVTMQDERKEDEGSDAVPAEPMNKSGLISEQTVDASTAAFGQLARAVARDRELPGGGRLVEDLVRESLEPMLKEWLDANLPTIVERLVRQEIERMVRRAEETS